MGAGIDQTTSYQMLDLFLQNGGNFIDTAKIYSDWIPGEKSRSEKLIGAWMQDRKNRQDVILATKGAHPHLESMHIPRLSPAEIVSDLEASLVHLQTDVIDLYWLHRDDRSRPVGEIVEIMNRLVRTGKIRYYGFSNWRADRLREAYDYANNQDVQSFSAVQNLWNLAELNQDGFEDKTIVLMDDDLARFHAETRIAAVPYSSQANGLFQKLDNGGPHDLPANLVSWYWNHETAQRYRNLVTLQLETGLSTTQIVLGYLTGQPFPVIPIIGPKSIAQLEDCLSALDVVLPIEQIHKLISDH